MHYADDRRQSLPLTSSYVDSTVKQLNYRFKVAKKLWNEEGAEHLLKLDADSLSDSTVKPAFCKRREAKETRQYRYRRTV